MTYNYADYSNHHYTLYVDEAGDDKLERLKPDYPNGNSEWLCIGGYLVRSPNVVNLDERRDELVQLIGGQPGQILHFRKYKAPNRLKICDALSSYSARTFVVCSYKKTMVGYTNPRARAAGTAGSERQYLYNWVTRLLLERVSEFIKLDAKKENIANPKLKIVMASRKGHHFGHFKAYILQLIRQATAKQTFIRTREIDPTILAYSLIERAPASTLSGLQLADTIVSATFQSIEQCSPAYGDSPARFLRGLFAGKRYNAWGPLRRNNFGLTVFPPKDAHNFLNAEQKRFFERFGYDFNWVQNNVENPH